MLRRRIDQSAKVKPTWGCFSRGNIEGDNLPRQTSEPRSPAYHYRQTWLRLGKQTGVGSDMSKNAAAQGKKKESGSGECGAGADGAQGKNCVGVGPQSTKSVYEREGMVG